MATELVLVVDRSGSMEGLKCMAVDAINSLVSSQAKIGGDCNLSIVMFDNKPKVVVDSKPISRKSGVTVENHPFTVEKLFCESGGTALLDAVGYTIDHIEKSKKRRGYSSKEAKKVAAMTWNKRHPSRPNPWNKERKRG